MSKDLQVAIAYPAFFSYFREYIPQLERDITPSDVSKFDLIIFSGGEDVDPSLYHETNDDNICFSNKHRDDIESAIFKECWRLNKKIFGVCRGHQLINVLLGGTLWQDLSLAGNGVPHPSQHKLKYINMHEFLNIVPPVVNSMHHQGARYTPGQMVPLAMWNGIPEISVSRDNRILTTQFHPEFMNNSGGKNIFDWILSSYWKVTKPTNKTLEDILEYEEASARLMHSRGNGQELRVPRLAITTQVARSEPQAVEINEESQPSINTEEYLEDISDSDSSTTAATWTGWNPTS